MKNNGKYVKVFVEQYNNIVELWIGGEVAESETFEITQDAYHFAEKLAKENGCDWGSNIQD